MDLLVRPIPENSLRVRSALDALSLTVPEDGFARLGQQAPLKNWYNADIITPPIGGPSFDDIAKDAVAAKLFNRPVRVPSVAMLIHLKEKAAESEAINAEAANKHRNDIELLKATSRA